MKVGVNIEVKDMFYNIVQAIRAKPGYTAIPQLPNFYYGYWPEVANILAIKSQNSYAFPAIILHANIPDKAGADYRYSKEISPSIYIVSQTKPTYSGIDRIENIYKPILYPIYERLIQEVKNSKYFNLIENGREIVPHNVSDLLYLNSEAKNQNKLNDFVDAIEVKFDSLKVYKKQIFKIK